LDGELCGYTGNRTDFCFPEFALPTPIYGPPVTKSATVTQHHYRLRAIDFEGKRHSFWLHQSIPDGDAGVIAGKLGLRKAA